MPVASSVLPGGVSAAVSERTSEVGLLRLDGEYWSIGFDGHVIRVRDTRGVRYLAVLLRRPGERLRADELRAAAGSHGSGDAETLPTGGVDARVEERARLAVTKGIRAALARIEAASPELGQHLQATIRRGYLCAYVPDPRHPIRWEG